MFLYTILYIIHMEGDSFEWVQMGIYVIYISFRKLFFFNNSCPQSKISI